jgi:hypothetical protein
MMDVVSVTITGSDQKHGADAGTGATALAIPKQRNHPKRSASFGPRVPQSGKSLNRPD